MKAPHITVIGAVNMDICGRPYGKLVLHDSNPGRVVLSPGGVGRNIAHNLRLLGAEVTFVTAFGEDVYAGSIRQSCLELGFDLSCSLTVPNGRTGTYLYLMDSSGDMAVGLSDMDISKSITTDFLKTILHRLNESDLVILDGNLQEDTILFLTENCTAPLFADPVSAAKAHKLLPALGGLYALKPNQIEAQFMTGETTPEDAARIFLWRGIKQIFISLGPEGLCAGDASGIVRLPCPPTRLVDATGGGDAMMAALAFAHTQGMSAAESGRFALAAASIAVEAQGAINPRLSTEQIAKHMA